MADTTYTTGTVVTSDWLNDVNDTVYGLPNTTSDVKGSSLVGYLPAGAGATGRTVQAKLRETVSVTDFGAVGDDSTDDTDAIQAAINSISQVYGGEVYFPSGLYKVTGQLFINYDGVTLRGEGPRNTTIRVHHNLGDAVVVQAASSPGTTYINSFGMFNIGVRARTLTTSGACVYLNKVQNVALDNVWLEDHFGGLHIGGGNQIYISNLHILSPRTSSPVSWTGIQAGSFFLKIGQSSGGHNPNELFISNFNFRRNESVQYIENGIVINAVDGVWFSNGHIMGVDQADCRIEPIAGTEQIAGIKFSNCWFDNNAKYGVVIAGNTSALYAQVEFDNCDFLTHTVTALFVDAAATAFEGIRIAGGWMRKGNLYGILLRAGRNHVIRGVDFGAMNTDAAANTAAISIDSGVDNVSIIGCIFDEYGFSVTSPSMKGIYINAYASGNILASGNTFKLTDTDVTDGSTVDTNAFPGNITTKASTATAIGGSSLIIAEIGDQFYVSNGLNFDNMTGRWNNRKVTLVFAGVSTVTHIVGGIRLSGSVNFVSKAGDTLTLLYSPDLADWIEVSRMVS